jgi:hypothetical protein
LNPNLSIDGVPVLEWLYRARKACIEKELARLADEDMALASHTKKMLAAWEQKWRDENAS